MYSARIPSYLQSMCYLYTTKESSRNEVGKMEIPQLAFSSYDLLKHLAPYVQYTYYIRTYVQHRGSPLMMGRGLRSLPEWVTVFPPSLSVVVARCSVSLKVGHGLKRKWWEPLVVPL